MSEHTKGPWIQEPAMSSAAHDRAILQVGGFTVIAQVPGKIQSEAIANARLIAAAPDLLEACEAQLRVIDTLMARLMEVDHTFMPTPSGHLWKALLQSKEAIAKATNP